MVSHAPKYSKSQQLQQSLYSTADNSELDDLRSEYGRVRRENDWLQEGIAVFKKAVPMRADRFHQLVRAIEEKLPPDYTVVDKFGCIHLRVQVYDKRFVAEEDALTHYIDITFSSLE